MLNVCTRKKGIMSSIRCNLRGSHTAVATLPSMFAQNVRENKRWGCNLKIKKYDQSGVRYGEFLDSQRHSKTLVGQAKAHAMNQRLHVVRWANGNLSIALEDPRTELPTFFYFVISEKELIEGIRKLPKQK